MPAVNELLIVSVTPQNLERGALWFSENADSIRRARTTNVWWRQNSLIIETDLTIKPFELAERLMSLGYERSNAVPGRGLFAVRGGIVDIWPINTDKPLLIEFSGNVITTIHEHQGRTEIVKPRPTMTRSIQDLPAGSFVVHQDHGIGIFRGISEQRDDSPLFFIIEYAPPSYGREPDRLLVPLEQKERLTAYIGFETPHIHRLGGTLWQSTARKAKEDAEKLARQLLELYAKRNAVTRVPYEGDTHLEDKLREGFMFQETPDQLRCEQEILGDLMSDKPMDRVLCGDVGFGKTELAIRAALRVIASGKQAMILSPTTILAAQHAQTIKDRFSNLPVRTAMLSRITSPMEEKKILAEIKSGEIDCVIGTHRLLSKDIEFKNLGIAVIDEEQRFGVKQKERLKEMRGDVDIISLSATPIPRTMQLTMAKLRDISLLETPPPERLAIATFVLPHRMALIKEAIERELDRGGQVYFLHNRIDTMGMKRERLFKLLKHYPALGIGIIHGRMKEKELLSVMDDFRAKKIHVLMATTIIENGLDISSANTLIVDDATRLGLAQAHQLRGRIGRGTDQAYAYFLYRPKHVTEHAAERLEALRAYADLGSGYQIALRDLEIRGAGNILGREQSGTVNKVGLNLYCHMLSESIEWLQQHDT
ncbi:MAG: helicase-related protein [Candidatus Sungbacteria bacterium]|nr:helicase-related protein [bacterium]MDZ4260293.1 helicase-related protein [Candidatus Sungbacteria bacterium]